ncbi:MAG: phage head morphogenesis protein, partial [Clostridiales bacterium]|nr:phage head morphogenesis protein [Clostridiales bacterium]
MPDKKTLDYYVSELRRIEKSRQADSEKEIKKIYRELKKDLNSFLANEYADFSNGNGILSVALLQEKARYAKFLEEVDNHLNSITPGVSKAIQSTVKKTYKAVYEGMIDAVTSSVDSDELKTKLKGLSIRPEVMNRAINNPISGLTLPDTLEKHRKDVIYNIKQQINTGLMTGERYDTMAKNINKVLSGDDGAGGMYGKAIRIVRTEVHRVQEEGLLDCAKDISEGLEGSGLIYAATWHNMGDQKVRPNVRRHTAKGWKTYKSKTTANHEKLDGMTIRVGDKFEIEPGVFTECPGSSGTARNDC